MSKLNAKQWSNYWQKGTITTFHKKFENNYDGEIKDHWDKVFNSLLDNSCVVDLATGNGALLSLLDEFVSRKDKLQLKAYGIDFAEINLEIVNKIKLLDLKLKENTLIEATGLKNDSVTLAISQYGIEYSELDKSVNELDRILKPQASINFIMHNNESQIIKEGFQTIEQISLINNKLKLNTIIRNMLPAIESLKKTGKQKYKIKADKLRVKLNNAIQEMMTVAQTLDDPGYIQFYYENALSVFKGVVAKDYSITQKLKIIKHVEFETENLLLRMKDLTSVAMNKSKNDTFIKQLNKIGFKDVSIKPINYNNYLIGQILSAERNG